MNRTTKTAVLRSLNRAISDLRIRLEFRKKHTGGDVEAGHLLGLQDGERDILAEIDRVKKLREK